MTTTPDSRIRADWTLPAETAAPPPTVTPDTSTTATPDTSTTAGKIAVMQAAERGERIESTPLNPRDHAFGLWSTVTGMAWNWGLQDYRIAPPPVARTALQQAREYTMTAPDKVNASSMARLLVALLQDIDDSVVVEAFPCDGSTKLTTFVAITGPLTPGRYRLLRDDA